MLDDGSIGIYNTKAGNKIKIHRRIKISLDSKEEKYIYYISRLLEYHFNQKPIIYKKKRLQIFVYSKKR